MTSPTLAPPNHPPTARVRMLLLAGVSFLLGGILAGLWFHRSSSEPERLSASTRSLLGQLPASVTLRYHCRLDSPDPTLQAFAGRVVQLLQSVQAAGGGKIQLSLCDTPSSTSPATAAADGLRPFNLDKGEACFLGIAVTSGSHRETIARLQPEWEAALECDLARAISSVATAAGSARSAPEVARPGVEIIASLHRLLPDGTTVSMAEADAIFHSEFLKECGEVGAAGEAQVNAAQRQVVQAQNEGSLAALAAARENLLQVQLARTGKLKEIAERLYLRQVAFQQMPQMQSPLPAAPR